MPYTRVDSQHVVDEAGNQIWLPDLSDPGNQLMQPDFSSGASLPYGRGHQFGEDFTPEAPMNPRNQVMAPDFGHPDLPLDGSGAQFSGPGGQLANVQGAPPDQIRARVEAASPKPALGDPYAPPGLQDPYAKGAPGRGVPQAGGPPGDQLGLKPPKTVADAEGNVYGAEQGEEQATLDAANQKFEADKQLGQRKVDAAQQEVRDRDKLDAEAQAMREAYNHRADQETAAWLKEMDDVSKTKVDPKHFWYSQSGFSQAMWLLGVVAGTIGSEGDASKNPALQMLNHAIDQDVANQRDEIGRRMEMMRTKGQALQQHQARELANVNDTITAKYQRLLGLEKVADLQASQTTDQDKKAQLAQTKAVLVGQRKDLAIAMYGQKRQEADAARSRALEERGQNLEMERFRTTTALGVIQHAEDLQEKYDTAEMRASAAEQKAAKAAEDKDQEIDPHSGVTLVDEKTGVPIGQNVTVPKEVNDKVQPMIQAAIQKKNGLVRIQKALKDATTFGWTTNTDNELNEALLSLADPSAKAMGAKLGPEIIDKIAQQYVGYNLGSIKDKLLGDDREKIVKNIDRQIARIPREMQASLSSFPGVKIPKGARIGFSAPDTLGPDEPQAPGSEESRAMAGNPVKRDLIASPEDYKIRKLTGNPVPELDRSIGSEGASFVENTLQDMRRSNPFEPDKSVKTVVDAVKSLKNPDGTPLDPAQQRAVVAQVQGEAEMRKAQAEKALKDFESELASMKPGYLGPPSIERAEKLQKAYGFDLTPEDLLKAVEDAKLLRERAIAQ